MRKTSILFLATSLLLYLPAAQAEEDEAARNAYNYRISIMTTLKGHIGAISMIMRGMVEDHGYLDEHAQALANSVAEIEHVFPAGSNVEDSKALAAIWEDSEAFNAAWVESRDASAAFAEATKGDDAEAMRAAAGRVFQSCKGCHDNYRQQDD